MADERELILENIRTTCDGITKANGYAVNVKLVSRKAVSIRNLKAGEMPALLIYGGPEELDYYTNKQLQVKFRPQIIGVVEDDIDDIDTALNALYDAFFDAIHEDEGRGGYADSTRVTSMATDRGPHDTTPARRFVAELEIVFERNLS